LARFVLDFTAANGGLAPPTFLWFRDASTHKELPPPPVFASAAPAWTYFFDYSFPVPNNPLTNSVEWGIVLNGVGLTDAIIQPGGLPTRFYLDFGQTNGGKVPGAGSTSVLTSYRDVATGTAIAPPTVFLNAAPAWNYFFDAVWPTGTSQIVFTAVLGGVSLSDVITAPPATAGQGGAMTLLALRNLIRQESDTEGDSHIGDPELTSYINQSRFRLFDKLITMFDSDYFTANATFITDGINFQFPLPDGTLYGGAPPFYKGELLEVISGGIAQPNSPITLLPFNFREKNRYIRPFSMLAVPQMFPRYRIMGGNPNNPTNPSAPWNGNIIFTPLPNGGMQCRLWYAPKLAPLVNDPDVADDFGGWLELVVVDCAIKVMIKQERDPSALAARKNQLLLDLDQAAANRNLGDPNTVIETADEAFGARIGWPGAGAWGGSGWF